MNNKIFASGVKKQKEEKHEFVFEETQSIGRGNKTSRSISRSKEPSRPTSLTPRGVRTQEKKQQTPQQQPSIERSVEKIPSQTDTDKKNFFQESSRRLKAMDEGGATESRFK